MNLASSKFGRFALGLVAAGGTALLLTGTAMASSTSATTNDTNNSTTTLIDQTNQTILQSTSETNVTGTGVIVAPDNSQGNPPTSQTGAGGTTNSGGTGSSVPAAASTPDVNATSALPAASPAAPGISSSEPADSVVAMTPAVALSTLGTPIYHPSYYSSFLATVAPAATPVELAAMPIASSPTKQPTVPKTSGDLTALSNQLAGTIVPEFFHALTALGSFPGLVAFVTFAGVAFILMSLIRLTYGNTLRLSGYATAARSDMARFLLSFATPPLLDYVVALPPPVVLFGGVRNQYSNSYVMSPTLQRKEVK